MKMLAPEAPPSQSDSRLSAYLARHRDRFVKELQEFVRIPSVSSAPRHAPNVQRCATWLAGQLKRVGLEKVRIIPTRRHPIVYGKWFKAPQKPVVLIYGHYDVQPAEPERDWKSPPFAAVIRNGFLYGRGSSD